MLDKIAFQAYFRSSAKLVGTIVKLLYHSANIFCKFFYRLKFVLAVLA